MKDIKVSKYNLESSIFGSIYLLFGVILVSYFIKRFETAYVILLLSGLLALVYFLCSIYFAWKRNRRKCLMFLLISICFLLYTYISFLTLVLWIGGHSIGEPPY